MGSQERQPSTTVQVVPRSEQGRMEGLALPVIRPGRMVGPVPELPYPWREGDPRERQPPATAWVVPGQGRKFGSALESP